MSLTFTSLTSPIHRGSYATATVKTKPGAYCTIVVEYKSGPATAAGLGPKSASSTGVASWTWKVGTRTTLGSWPVTVTCSSGGLSKSVTKYLQVV
jgi:micrococcal nuclease